MSVRVRPDAWTITQLRPTSPRVRPLAHLMTRERWAPASGRCVTSIGAWRCSRPYQCEALFLGGQIRLSSTSMGVETRDGEAGPYHLPLDEGLNVIVSGATFP